MATHWTPPSLSFFRDCDEDVAQLPDTVLVRFRQTAEDAARFARRMDASPLADRYEATVEHIDAYLEDRRFARYLVQRDQLRLTVEA